MNPADTLADVASNRIRTEPNRNVTVGTFIHGLLGAAMGAGIAKGVSATLPVSPSFADKLETAAMAIGAHMNTGVLKLNAAQDEVMAKQAFRLGFASACRDTKLLEKEAGLLPIPSVIINPADIASIPRGAAQATVSAIQALGSGLGAADAVDENEETLTNIAVEKSLLQEKLRRIMGEKRNGILRKVLANRKV